MSGGKPALAADGRFWFDSQCTTHTNRWAVYSDMLSGKKEWLGHIEASSQKPRVWTAIPKNGKRYGPYPQRKVALKLLLGHLPSTLPLAALSPQSDEGEERHG